MTKKPSLVKDASAWQRDSAIPAIEYPAPKQGRPATQKAAGKLASRCSRGILVKRLDVSNPEDEHNSLGFNVERVSAQWQNRGRLVQIEQECRAFTERIGVKFGNFVHPVRAALTGTDKGPGLFDVVFLLGKDACVKRLRAAAQS